MAKGSHNEPVAVIGLSCRFPGASGATEFWRVLRDGESHCREVPAARFPTSASKRNGSKSIYYGNFLDNIDEFDRKFFKKSSREAASMDPQQRILLETSYQALESAGYFGPNLSSQEREIGCFIGVCASDYNDNIASHQPNAYSSLGSLRAFLAGKISHFYGWTGPSMTIDTACSSSGVAIHTACSALQQGDCQQALAGGVSVFTSPYFFQNLAAASFLSPTGPTKSFDAQADGYCRGEGVGLVVLKRLSEAIEAGDTIRGVILSTAVSQSSSEVPITVPSQESQIALYDRLLRKGNVLAEDVNYVEAHGTGTRVGDSIEYEGIKQIFGGKQRRDMLHFASVKGNIGHSEGASGAAALIKTILMMEHRTIVKQANFLTLHPKIDAAAWNMAVPTKQVPWGGNPMLACINNYGASGSIAAMLVKEPPSLCVAVPKSKQSMRFPVWLSAGSVISLESRVARLSSFLQVNSGSISAPDMGFALSGTLDRSLAHFVILVVADFVDLRMQLELIGSGSARSRVGRPVEKVKPVVFLFGGQSSRCVNLNKLAFEKLAILHPHLDRCNQLYQALRSQDESIYTVLFDYKPIQSIALLNVAQFALQYACAQAWLDSGLQIDCMIGHSFGQLVALAVSGVLSLEDGLKFVHERGVLLEKVWPETERGAMISIVADLSRTKELLADSKHSQTLEIACFNSASGHVVVGTRAEIDDLANILLSRNVTHKKLDVSHGFHSRLSDAIMPELYEVARGLQFGQARIPIEFCTADKMSSMDCLGLAEHTRRPVYFAEAVRRVEQRFGVCTWMATDVRPSVVNMARRAVQSNMSAQHTFLAVDVAQPSSRDTLADVTASLWNDGHSSLQFWPFHKSQKRLYVAVDLPPYHFERERCWLDFIEPVATQQGREIDDVLGIQKRTTGSPVLLQLVTEDEGGREMFDAAYTGWANRIFRIDPKCEVWRGLLEGHAVLQKPLCPAPLYLEVAAQAAQELHRLAVASSNNAKSPGRGGSGSSPVPQPDISTSIRFDNLTILSPLCSSDEEIQLHLRSLSNHETARSWGFAFYTKRRSNRSAQSWMKHTEGSITLVHDTEIRTDFAHTERLLSHTRVSELLASSDGESMSGPLIYRVFEDVVSYKDYYKGVRHVCAKGDEVAALVRMPPAEPRWAAKMTCNPLALDNFLQVPGLRANCLVESMKDAVFVCTKIDRILIRTSLDRVPANSSTQHHTARPAHWLVYACSKLYSGNELENDIYVFNADTCQLELSLLGVHFNKVARKSLHKALTRAGPGHTEVGSLKDFNHPLKPTPVAFSDDVCSTKPWQAISGTLSATHPPQTPHESPSTQDVTLVQSGLRQLLADLTDVSPIDVNDNVSLDELGIDSLMASELITEIIHKFGVTIRDQMMADLTTFSALCEYIIQAKTGEVKLQNQSEPHNVAITSVPISTDSESTSATELMPVEANGTDQAIDVRLTELLVAHLDCQPPLIKENKLADLGLDSLLCIELADDINRILDVSIDVVQVTACSTLGDLWDLIITHTQLSHTSNAVERAVRESRFVNSISPMPQRAIVNQDFRFPHSGTGYRIFSKDAARIFRSYQTQIDQHNANTGFSGFFKHVYPAQTRLVTAYVVEAFQGLGCDLSALRSGEEVWISLMLPKYARLSRAMYDILRDAGLVVYCGHGYLRTRAAVDESSSQELYAKIVSTHPLYVNDHQLLHTCGSRLPSLLRGDLDPLRLLFANKEANDLLVAFYRQSPMYVAVHELLIAFLETVISQTAIHAPIRILEIGAGTGSTTRWILELLTNLNIPYNYIFSDLSSSLVNKARRAFSMYANVDFVTLDIENLPQSEYLQHFDIILSTNCIHATRSLTNSLAHIRAMLKPSGFLLLLECTQNLPWFDLVFGLLDGWWSYEDGRDHPIAEVDVWEASLKTAGFENISMTNSSVPEASIVRVIAAFNDTDHVAIVEPGKQRTKLKFETVCYASTDGINLLADIYLPSSLNEGISHKQTYPIALLIHGGGHVMLSRKDVPQKQIRWLLQHGVLPISIDYRLCPELNVVNGPMTDARQALRWVRETLPTLNIPALARTKLNASKVVAIGWSSGGTTALSLAWTCQIWEIDPPDAILAFYCPTDFEDQFWTTPNYPFDTKTLADDTNIDLCAGVAERPLTEYNLPIGRTLAGWMCVNDSRSQILLHMNWRAQTVPVLFHGLTSKRNGANSSQNLNDMTQPTNDQISEFSPLAQVRKGHFRTPTYLIHGTKDDLIPWQQSQRMYEALRSAQVPAGLGILQDQPHLFDGLSDRGQQNWTEVVKGYQFLLEHLAVAKSLEDNPP